MWKLIFRALLNLTPSTARLGYSSSKAQVSVRVTTVVSTVVYVTIYILK